MKVLLTGAFGQLGYVSWVSLVHKCGFDVVPAGRVEFDDPEALRRLVGDCDAVVHLAGVNRGADAEVAAGNPALATALVEACRDAGAAPHIVYSSTIQISRDNAYGESKRKAGDILKAFCGAAGAPYTDIVLPNLFGEFSRPGYNNFTGTFCHQVARGEAPTVNSDAPVSLMHYSEAADVIAQALERGLGGSVEPQGYETSVGTVAGLLQRFAADYATGTIPPLANMFETRLFNAYRQVLYPDMFPARLTRHTDARGSFFECIREYSGGQTSFSTTVPGITRGDHFHFDKIERFLVLAGQARISVRRLFDDQVRHFDVSGDEPVFIDMPTFHTHNITNTGDAELLTLFWANEHFDRSRPDTYPEQV